MAIPDEYLVDEVGKLRGLSVHPGNQDDHGEGKYLDRAINSDLAADLAEDGCPLRALSRQAQSP